MLSDKGPITSLQAAFTLSTGYQTDTTALSLAPPLGDGQNDFELRALIGQSILRHAAFYNLDIGHRARSKTPVDEIPYENLFAGRNTAVGRSIGVASAFFSQK